MLVEAAKDDVLDIIAAELGVLLKGVDADVKGVIARVIDLEAASKQLTAARAEQTTRCCNTSSIASMRYAVGDVVSFVRKTN